MLLKEMQFIYSAIFLHAFPEILDISLTGEGKITIEGKLKFDKAPGKMPNSSCLKIEFEDVALQDVASILYEEEEYEIAGDDIGKSFSYKMETRRPKSLVGVYSMSAVLNVGWCPEQKDKEWVRDNDFLSETIARVPLNDTQDRYQVDIPVVFYCKLHSRNFLVIFMEFLSGNSCKLILIVKNLEN